MWTVIEIAEADYGCEERMPGEPLMALVTLQCDDGRVCQFEAAENWLSIQGIEEGDEWPEDPDEVSDEESRALSQEEWMYRYYDAVEELNEQ